MKAETYIQRYQIFQEYGASPMRGRPFIINQDGSGKRFQSIEAKKGIYDEGWLQELLRKQPELLPVADIESIFYPLIPIGREVNTNSGAIDNLFISPRGYLVLVETKLWKNPEGKREVLAQAIDYGSSLSKWTYTQLNTAARQYTKRFEKKEMDLVEWVESLYGPIEGGRIYFEDTVRKNLRLGRFLTLIVGDRIRQSLIDIIDHVNRYPHLAIDVALVEMQVYDISEDNKGYPLLIVPNVVAKTEIIDRSIVQITITKDGNHKIDVKQEKTKDDKKKRISLTEEAFWELLKKQSPDDYEKARKLIDEYKEREDIAIDPADTSIVARLDINDSGYRASTFYVSQNGHLGVWPRTIATQLEKAGLDRKLAEDYGSEMRTVLKMPARRVELSCPVKNIDLERFKSVVNSFIDKVKVANSERV